MNDNNEPANAEECFRTHAELKKAVEDFDTRLSGTPQQKQEKLFARIKAFAKAQDLTFHQTWNLVMNEHPQLNEDLPTPYAPKLRTITEQRQEDAEHDQRVQELRQQKKATASTGDLIEGFARQAHENRVARTKKLQASDPNLSFADAWSQTAPEKFVEIPVQNVQADELPPGTYLVHGVEAGMTCPLFGD